ncbi:MAG: RNA polymerase sigma factor [candidate division Zixibacteria bacterium]|nr:RNA polymerase sigma factor [candidate division Zixibacteria bacterium]
MGSREEAEDITQDVLIKLWEHRSSMDRDRVLPWTLRVAHNACLDVHRKRQVRNGTPDGRCQGGNCPETIPAPNPSPEAELERSDLRRQIESGLQQIDEPYRTIVILREIQDMSYEEVSAAMAMPLNTIKVYLHRGRRMLRELIQEKASHDTVGA